MPVDGLAREQITVAGPTVEQSDQLVQPGKRCFLLAGLAGLAKAFDPELIVVGGGVLEEGESILGAAREELVARYKGQVDPPAVVSASLGNDAGVVGAAQLSLEAASARGIGETHGG